MVPASASLLTGQAVDLTAIPRDNAGNALSGRRIVWATNNATVATVSESGHVAAVGVGAAVITATCDGQTASAAITVTAERPAVASLVINPPQAVLQVGGKLTLVATVRGPAGETLTDRRVDWSSSDGSRATVSGSGDVTAVSAGAVTITATSEGKTATASVRVPLLLSSLAVGVGATCGLTQQGKAFCWGFNAAGQLGDGSTVNRNRPVAVAGNLTFRSLTVGFAHACGLTTTGEGYCWGENLYGQLGTSATNATCVENGYTSPCSTLPVLVSGGLRFTQLDAGGGHTCGIAVSGTAYCWGRNQFGQLGSGSTTQTNFPVAVVGGFQFVAITAGGTTANGGQHTCGITTGGLTLCWGNDWYGQLGDGQTGTTRSSPTPVAGGLRFQSVNAGYEHTCGVTTDGVGYCWGSDWFGELGNGSRPTKSVPDPVAGGLRFASIGPHGWSQSCGVTVAGAAYCWGFNDVGQLGAPSDEACTSNGVTRPCSTDPIAVSGNLVFADVGAAGWHACGLTVGGEAYCWGHSPSGELGHGSISGSMTPVRVIDP
jgi:alpha-tubulin suppressor-like RCC1 family protein